MIVLYADRVPNGCMFLITVLGVTKGPFVNKMVWLNAVLVVSVAWIDMFLLHSNVWKYEYYVVSISSI